MGLLDGKVAIVTGAGRGLGRSHAHLLAAEGAAVVVNDLGGEWDGHGADPRAASETAAEITSGGGRAVANFDDVADWEGGQRLINQAVETFGKLDILVCNAGVASKGMPVALTEPAELANVIGVHALGPHYMARGVLPSMRTRSRGDIVMISSVATSHMGPNGAPYNMGKAAMEALALTLAKEERPHGIHVNVVAPGLVETDMGVRLARAMTGQRELQDLRSLDQGSPFGRVCQPLDVANVVLWLCSEGASYVTGQRIECDGGGPR